MRSPMDEKTFLNFYKNTVLGYSNNLQRNICRLLEEQHRITFKEEREEDVKFFELRKDFHSIIIETTTNIKFADFYEEWEFKKLYKYSVPLFFEVNGDENIKDILEEKKIPKFISKDYKPEFILHTCLKETLPFYWIEEEKIFIKFVLQKTYLSDKFDQIDYRYPIIIYINTQKHFLEIRYDAIRYGNLFDNGIYEKLVNDCILWLQQEIGLKLFLCEHDDTIKIINDKQNEEVKMYKQMMQMSSGGAAELTASESQDYVLPFVGEIRELIDENEELFNQSEDIKKLLMQYINDKEATASTLQNK